MVDDPADAWDHERDGDVGVWFVHDFAALFTSDEMDRAEQHYRETAADEDMDGTVVVVRGTDELGKEMRETLEHINEGWSELADAVDVGRLAYVTDGIFGIAIQGELETDADAKTFDTVEEAVAWAR
jgi:hypothetical protein